MRETNTKIKKSIFRIAICSIGGVLTIFGIMFCLYFLVQLLDTLSKYPPYFFIAVLILSVGLYLCFLVIKPMRYFVKSRKISKEEKVIENIKKYMQKGESRIAAISFIVILNIFVLILIYLRVTKLSKVITSEDIRLINLVNKNF